MKISKPIQLKNKDVPALRKRILKKQRGVCPICGKFVTKPVLDHHHKKRNNGSGLIRGVLCSGCNIFLAKLENNCKRYNIPQKDLPRVLVRSAYYLKKKQYPYIHPSEAPKAPILMHSSYNQLQRAVGGRQKIPIYRVTSKGKPAQKLTIPLAALFKKYNILPKFYK